MKKLFLCCGIPGSGKTTWVKNQVAEHGGVHISRDAIRFETLSENDDYFANESIVYATFVLEIQNALNNDNGHQNVYADATHLNEKSRRMLLDKLNLSNVEEIILLHFDIKIETALERNAKRSGRALVPEKTIRSMNNNLSLPPENGKYSYKIWKINEKGEVLINE